MEIANSELLCFDDVLIRPLYSDIRSRSEICLGSDCNGLGLSIPIVASPMDTVTETDMARGIGCMGGLGVIHRYNTIEQQVDLVLPAPHAACAIGVSGDFLDRATALYEVGVRTFCIDVAHGHTSMMKKAIEYLRDRLGDDIHIMAGNVATLDAFNDLADWGANSIRVGIGGGSICSTRIQTGHGMPTLASVLECGQSDRDAALIADGGIRTPGDIAKCLGAGADAVMLGSLLAGTDEAPGEIIIVDGEKHKVYRGMASKEAQIDWRGHTASLEGVSSVVPSKGPVMPILTELAQNVRSALSYSGARTISEFQAKCQFERVSSLSVQESSTHILSRA
ncbi:MAG: guanosine monophosphate reductase [Candidatus Thorarchaeota archaeon]|jgi:IMP dehydrogenase